MPVILQDTIKKGVTLNNHTFFTRTSGGVNNSATTITVENGAFMPTDFANVECEVVADQDRDRLPYQALGTTKQNPIGEKFTYAGITNNDLTGITRGVDGTDTQMIFNKSWLQVTDNSGSADNNNDYIYVSGIKGNHIALYVIYEPSAGLSEAGIRITCATKPHKNDVSVAWHQISVPDSSNKSVEWEHLIDKPASAIADTILIPVNKSDNMARIRVEYLTPAGVHSNVRVDVLYEENRSVS